MKRAIIFGGAFNPPSRGHVWILGECARIARRTGAEVWVLPSGERRDKHIGISEELRIALCQAMVDDADMGEVRIRVITDELERDKPVETIDTVKKFARDYPNYRFTWVFGADSYVGMPAWRGGTWLIDTLDMIVVTRAGYTIIPRRNVTIIEGIHDDISSTQIRQIQLRGESVEALVTPHVNALLTSGKVRYTET